MIKFPTDGAASIMTDGTHLLQPIASAPLVLDPQESHRARSPDLPPASTRLTSALVGLALPASGNAVADTVHRAGEPRATQAAVPAIPLGGAAAPRTGAASSISRATLLVDTPAGDARRGGWATTILSLGTASSALRGSHRAISRRREARVVAIPHPALAWRSGGLTGHGGAGVIALALCLVLAAVIVGLLPSTL